MKHNQDQIQGTGRSPGRGESLQIIAAPDQAHALDIDPLRAGGRETSRGAGRIRPHAHNPHPGPGHDQGLAPAGSHSRPRPRSHEVDLSHQALSMMPEANSHHQRCKPAPRNQIIDHALYFPGTRNLSLRSEFLQTGAGSPRRRRTAQYASGMQQQASTWIH